MASILNVDKIRATGSTTDGLTIDSSGRLFQPQLVSFHVNKGTATLTIENNSTNVLKPNDVDFDTASGYSTSTGEYTVPVAGTYFFYAFGQLGSITADIRVAETQFAKNGSLLGIYGPSFGGVEDSFSGGPHPACGTSMVIQLAANDTIRVQSSTHADPTSNTLRRYNFGGYLIG